MQPIPPLDLLQSIPPVDVLQPIPPVDVLQHIPPVDVLQLIHGLSLVEPCMNMYITGKYRMFWEDFLYSAVVYNNKNIQSFQKNLNVHF